MTRRLRFRYRYEQVPLSPVGPMDVYAELACGLSLARPDLAGTFSFADSASVGQDLARLSRARANPAPARPRLRSIETEDGQVLMAWTFAPDGSEARVDYVGGLSTRFQRGPSGRVERVLREDGGIIRFRHLENGTLAQIEYPGRRLFEFTHDDRGRLETCSFPDGRTTRFAYNTRTGTLASVQHAGTRIEYGSNESGVLRSAVVRHGGVGHEPDLAATTLRIVPDTVRLSDGTHELHSALGLLRYGPGGELETVLPLDGWPRIAPIGPRWRSRTGELPLWSVSGQDSFEPAAAGLPASIQLADGARVVFHELDDRSVVELRPDGPSLIRRDTGGRISSLQSAQGTYTRWSYTGAGELASWKSDAARWRLRWDSASRLCRAHSPEMLTAQFTYPTPASPVPSCFHVTEVGSSTSRALVALQVALWHLRVLQPAWLYLVAPGRAPATLA